MTDGDVENDPDVVPILLVIAGCTPPVGVVVQAPSPPSWSLLSSVVVLITPGEDVENNSDVVLTLRVVAGRTPPAGGVIVNNDDGATVVRFFFEISQILVVVFVF
jgi:hypothetical protein